MSPLLLGPLVDLVGKISDKVWPDQAKKIEAQTALLQMHQRHQRGEAPAAFAVDV